MSNALTKKERKLVGPDHFRYLRSILTFALFLAFAPLLQAQTNHALDFDGADDYVDLPNAAYFSENNFTIEAWVYPRSYNLWSRVIDFSNGPADNNILMALSDGTSGLPAGSVFYGSIGTNFTATTQLALNTWSHLAITVKGSNARIYINGVLNSSHENINGVVDVERTLNYIGKSPWADGMADMILDELKIWKRALGPAHIANHRFHEPSPNEDDLVVYFDFDQGVAGADNTSITSLIDKSGNDYHGTFQNFNLNGTGSNFVTGVEISGEAVYLLDPNLSISETSFTKSLLVESFTLPEVTSSSPAPFTYSVVSGTSVSVDGATVEINEVGTSVVRIHQDAEAGYEESSIDVTINITTVPGEFTSPSDREVFGRYPWSVASGDLNGDGFTDMAATFEYPHNVLVYINDGTGAFRYPVSYDVGSGPRDIIVSDLDGDGKLDLATVNYNEATVSVLMNTGTGTFDEQVKYDVGGNPRKIVVGDLDDDGRLDLATVNSDDYTVSVLINTGDGFNDQVTYDVGNAPKSIVIGDLTGDGKLDLATANADGNTVSTLINTGDGTFYGQGQLDAGLTPNDLAIGDLDGDGKLDLAATNPDDGKISVFIGTGTGGFSTPVPYSAGPDPRKLAISDMDGDGKPDLVTSNYDGGAFSILVNTGAGTFNSPITYGSGSYNESLAIGDWNADTKPDLVITNRPYHTLTTFMNEGNGVFGDFTKINTAFYYTSLAAGDLNSDGLDDLVIGTENNLGLMIKMNLGNNTYSRPVAYEVGTQSYPVLGDLNGDGKLDVITRNPDDKTVSALINTGDGTFGTPIIHETDNDQLNDAALGDVDGDGMADLVTVDRQNASVFVSINAGAGTFGTPVRYGVGDEPMAVAMGDLNGDGKLDLAIANFDDYTVSVLINTGTGTFDNHVMYDVDREPFKIVMADLNGDGRLDLATANLDGRSISVLTNTGTGTFEPVANYRTNVDPSGGLTIGDMNGDGKPDLVVSFYNGYISILNNTGNGFESEVTYTVYESEGLFNVVTANLDNDGRPDLAGMAGSYTVFTLLNATVSNSQTISFAALNDKTYGDAVFELAAEASSSLPVTYTSSNTAVATINGNNVTIVGAGTTTIEASQSGGGFYRPATAVEQSLTVNKANQAITFTALESKTFGDATFDLAATTSSELAISYSSSNTAVASVSGNTVTIVGAGNTTITASQSGNNNFAAATAEQSLTVNKANQTITFAALPAKTMGDANFTLNATASSSLSVTYTSNDKVTINGSQVTLSNPGRATISAVQEGNNNYAAAVAVEQTFCVHPDKPVVTENFSDPTAPILTSSASSGNQWYRNNELVSGATGNTYTITTPGAYTVIVTVEGCASEQSNATTAIITDLEGKASTMISVYPNPVDRQIEILFNETGEKQLEIIDAQGSVMHRESVMALKTLVDIDEYSSGLYIVKVQTATSSYIKRFIKK